MNLPARNAQGFTLIEMMVALVLGLIVSAAVLAFIFSLIRANSETVLSTRLNQELRATMAVVTAELRRARGMRDPISAVATAGAVNNFAGVNMATAGCIRYAYETDAAALNFRAIRLNAGSLVLAQAAADPGCAAAGTPLNSDGIEITSITFTRPAGASDRRVDVQMTGRLRNPPAYMGANASMAVTSKTIRQTVSIRSNDS